MRHGSEWTIALKHRWDHVEGIAPPPLRPPKRFNWFYIKLAGTDLGCLLLPLSKLQDFGPSLVVCLFDGGWGCLGQKSWQRGGRLSLSEMIRCGERLMTVTTVVSFALCCATWLSTLILINAYLAVKGQYVIELKYIHTNRCKYKVITLQR